MQVHIAFLNPQGNFDPTDRGWTEHPDFGGQLVYVKEVALEMGLMGHKADILTRRIIDPQWPEFSEKFDAYPHNENIRIVRLPCGPRHFLPKEQLWPFLSEWVNHIIEFYGGEGKLPDALTAHYGDGGISAVMIQEKTQIPFTFTGHSLGAQKMDKLFEDEKGFSAIVEQFQFHKRIAAERVSITRASRIITSTKQEQIEQYGHKLYKGSVNPNDSQKFSVIPPGVNFRIFGHDQKNELEDKMAQKIQFMIRRDIPESRHHLPLVGCSSRLDEKKNHKALIQAWAVSKSLQDSANLALIISGSSNPLRERQKIFEGNKLKIVNEIVEIIDKFNLWSCIISFDLNTQSELAACYRYLAKNKRGIFALTSFHEPFGLAPLEAMAAGLPAVVTKNGGPSESLRDENGEYGVLVDPNSPEDIAGALTRLSQNEAHWKEMQSKGMKRIQDKYTWQQTATGYINVIEEMKKPKYNIKSELSIPGYFLNPQYESIDKKWLRDLYLD